MRNVESKILKNFHNVVLDYLNVNLEPRIGDIDSQSSIVQFEYSSYDLAPAPTPAITHREKKY
jgi:hypothetical protein